MAKKALVYKKTHQNHSVNDIMRVGEASEINGWTHHMLSEYFEKIDVPDGLDNDHLECVDVAEVAQYWSKDGETDVTEDPFDDTWTYHSTVPAHKEIQENATSKAVATKVADGTALYETYISDVETEMQTVFLTTKDARANAMYETWKIMSTKPELFSPKNLKCYYTDLTDIAENDILDTDAKVQNYADQLIARAESYGAFLAERYMDFKEATAAL